MALFNPKFPTCSKNCVVANMKTQAAVPEKGHNPARLAINAPTSATFRITDTKLYALVVTL